MREHSKLGGYLSPPVCIKLSEGVAFRRSRWLTGPDRGLPRPHRLHRLRLHATEGHRPEDRKVERCVGKRPPCHLGNHQYVLPGRPPRLRVGDLRSTRTRLGELGDEVGLLPPVGFGLRSSLRRTTARIMSCGAALPRSNAAALRCQRASATSCRCAPSSAATCRRPWASSAPKGRAFGRFSKVPLAGWLQIVALLPHCVHRLHLHAAEAHQPDYREVERFLAARPPCHSGNRQVFSQGGFTSSAAESAKNGSMQRRAAKGKHGR